MAWLEQTLLQHLQQTRIFVEVYSKQTTQQAQGHNVDATPHHHQITKLSHSINAIDATPASFKHGHTLQLPQLMHNPCT
jgi:hypothetical protein